MSAKVSILSELTSIKLPVNNMRMYKTRGSYHVAAKEYK
jgi:hypothetical protein